LLRRIEVFTPAEVACALEVFTRAAESGNREYVALVAGTEASLVGAIAYGETPMTDGTYDLYWIACDPARRRSGVGGALLETMEADLHHRHARLVRVETSGLPVYQPTRAFYERFQYRETARLRDFYRPGDDLVIFTKRL
jgi:ribosomal protein S18 acetylase RimI-like enzyme